MDATVYRYDGSFSGFLCCIYRAIRAREEPALILAGDEMPALLFPELAIHTDPDQARRVSRAIAGKIGPQVLEFAQRAHLTALAGRELYLLALLRRGFREGPLVLEDMADPTVCRLRRAVCHLEREAHLYKGFVRFQVRGEALSAVIQPKNRVLPLLAEHFRERFAAQALLIYDETHREALLCARGRSRGRSPPGFPPGWPWGRGAGIPAAVAWLLPGGFHSPTGKSPLPAHPYAQALLGPAHRDAPRRRAQSAPKGHMISEKIPHPSRAKAGGRMEDFYCGFR